MKIEITQEDINNGKRGHYDSCPIALAANRQHKNYKSKVGLNWIKMEGKWFMIFSIAKIEALPPEARAFIDFFDREIPVQPFTFEI